MLKIFFDTEFTDLNPFTKKLISVGLYGEDATGKKHSFYAELSDTYDTNDCSEFVLENVLPHLENKNVLKYFDLIVAMGSFIEDIDEDVMIISDAPTWDFTFFIEFFSQVDLRPNNIKHLSFFSGKNLVENWTSDLQVWTDFAAREHHALDDSIINSMKCKALLEKDGTDGIKILTTF